MTQFTVVWDQDLERHFIDAWTRSDSETRAMLTDVANWVDQELAVDADTKGQSGPGSIRILAVPISAAWASVAYQVVPEDRLVRVILLVFRR